MKSSYSQQVIIIRGSKYSQQSEAEVISVREAGMPRDDEQLWKSVRDVLAYEGSDFTQLQFCSIEVSGPGSYTIKAPIFAIPSVKRLTDGIDIILYQLTQQQVYGVWIEEVPVTSYQQKQATELGIL